MATTYLNTLFNRLERRTDRIYDGKNRLHKFCIQESRNLWSSVV